MKGFLDRHPSTAVLISLVALVMATVGTGYAALQLPKNSVGTAQLKKNTVTTPKIKKNAVTGAKVKKKSLTGSDINLKKLGTVPSAQVANGLAALEPTHIVGAANEPPFLSGSKSAPAEGSIVFPPVGFYKDHEGIVHLQGVAIAGGEGTLPGAIFQLPAGFRPAAGTTEGFETGGGIVFVFGSGVTAGGMNVEGLVYAPGSGALLSGLTFRAGS
jgi:hypothetical protein